MHGVVPKKLLSFLFLASRSLESRESLPWTGEVSFLSESLLVETAGRAPKSGFDLEPNAAERSAKRGAGGVFEGLKVPKWRFKSRMINSAKSDIKSFET